MKFKGAPKPLSHTGKLTFILFIPLWTALYLWGLQAANRHSPTTVTRVQYWVTNNYTRVVIDIDNQVLIRRGRLINPDRLYLDLLGARVTPELQAKNFFVQDNFLKRIRIGQHKAEVVRVVLETAGKTAFTIFPLYNPFRIVIDVHNGRDPSDTLSNKNSETKKLNSEDVETPISKKQVTGESPVPFDSSSKGAGTLTRALGLKIGKIVIDPGHGGSDTGTIGKNGLKEKDLVLDVAKRLYKLLEQRSVANVVLTRDDDTFIPLEDRTAFANEQGADLFVSIHANASKDKHASGVETYFLSLALGEEASEIAARENASSKKNIHELDDLVKKIALHEKVGESREFAACIQNNLVASMKKSLPKTKNRGVKHAPFIVLIGARMPSILIEIGFLSNPNDEKFLRGESSRDKIADSLSRGIQAYMKSLGDGNLALRGSH